MDGHELPRAVLDLVEKHGLYNVAEALADAARWKSHHYKAHHEVKAEDRYRKAAAALHWLAHVHCRDLT